MTSHSFLNSYSINGDFGLENDRKLGEIKIYRPMGYLSRSWWHLATIATLERITQCECDEKCHECK